MQALLDKIAEERAMYKHNMTFLKSRHAKDTKNLSDEYHRLLIENDDLKSDLSLRERFEKDYKKEIVDLKQKLAAMTESLLVLAERIQELELQLHVKSYDEITIVDE
jgi:predicted phage-related endonuclease